MTDSKKLQVEAILNGTVIDHIPSGRGVKILQHLHLPDLNGRITVGFNLPSKIMQLKDIIKVENRLFTEQESGILAVFAPQATLNIIKNYQVIKKTGMIMPSVIQGIFACPNSNCITWDEPITTSFSLSAEKNGTILNCLYCERSFTQEILVEIQHNIT